MSSPRLRVRAKTGCDESGQAMVEFALVLPLVLLLLFGLLQFALVFNARQTVAYAADAAARTYAQTLDEQGANADAARAAAALRPGLVAPAASITYSIVDPSSAAERAVQGARTDVRERWERRCVSRRFGSCRRYAFVQVGTERREIAADLGKRGEYVVARVTYRYPSPIRAGIGPFRFPAEFPITMEGVARIEADKPGARAAAPVASPSPTPAPTPTPTPAPLARCYRVNTVRDAWDFMMPYTPRFLVNGSPATTIRLVPGSTAKVTLRLDPKPNVAPAPVAGHYYSGPLDPFDPVPASPVVNETITVTEAGFTKTYSGGRLLWALKQGGAINFYYWATLTIVPVGQGC